MKKISILVIFILLLPVAINSAPRKAPYINLFNNAGQRVNYFSKIKRIFKKTSEPNIIISFWASYCAPCKKEMPVLIDLEKKYGTEKNIKLLLINVDINEESMTAKDKADETLREIGVKYEYLLDIYQQVLKKYNPKKNVPATFLVDKNGLIIFEMIGFHKDTLVRLEEAIKNLK